jgi:hypothetical protein
MKLLYGIHPRSIFVALQTCNVYARLIPVPSPTESVRGTISQIKSAWTVEHIRVSWLLFVRMLFGGFDYGDGLLLAFSVELKILASVAFLLAFALFGCRQGHTDLRIL